MHLAQRLFLAGWPSSKVSLVYTCYFDNVHFIFKHKPFLHEFIFYFTFYSRYNLDKKYAKPFPRKAIFN